MNTLYTSTILVPLAILIVRFCVIEYFEMFRKEPSYDDLVNRLYSLRPQTHVRKDIQNIQSFNIDERMFVDAFYSDGTTIIFSVGSEWRQMDLDTRMLMADVLAREFGLTTASVSHLFSFNRIESQQAA